MGFLGSAMRLKAMKPELPIIHDFEQCESDLVSDSEEESGVDGGKSRCCSSNEERKLYGSERPSPMEGSEAQPEDEKTQQKRPEKKKLQITTDEADMSEFERTTSPIKLNIPKNDAHVGLRKSDENVLATDRGKSAKKGEGVEEKPQEEPQAPEQLQPRESQPLSQNDIKRAIGGDKNRLKHIYTLARVTRKGGKYKVEEKDLLSQFDTETRKFKNRMQDRGNESPKFYKKERVNPPYIFGTAFVKPDDDQHVHAKYTAICKTDCHFMTINRRHLNLIQERIQKK